MANNLDVLDAAGATKTVKSTDNAGVHTPHHNVDSLPPLPAGGNNIGDVDVLTLPASATGTRTQVSDSASDGVILAANANRRGATIFNDSSAILFLGLGTTAVTSTNYTAKLVSGAYYEVPYNFTGQIRGLWATDPNDGAARVTELT